MAYVLTNSANDTVVTYPYSIGLLRRDNPDVSFPASPSLAQLAVWNVYPVVIIAMPPYDPVAYNIAEVTPIKIGSDWTQQWELTPVPQETADERYVEYVSSAEAEAASLLAATDTYLLKSLEDGVRIHPDLSAYRLALKNASSLTGYPVNTVWPTLPSNLFDGSGSSIDAYTRGETDLLLAPIQQEFIDVVNADVVSTFEQSLL